MQLDGAVDEVFLNVTPLHRVEQYIQQELNKLQMSVRHGERGTTKLNLIESKIHVSLLAC